MNENTNPLSKQTDPMKPKSENGEVKDKSLCDSLSAIMLTEKPRHETGGVTNQTRKSVIVRLEDLNIQDNVGSADKKEGKGGVSSSDLKPIEDNYSYQFFYKKGAPKDFKLNPAYEVCKIQKGMTESFRRHVEFAVSLLPGMGVKIGNDPIKDFNDNFFLTRVPENNNTVDKTIFRRCVERDVKRDPPILYEICEKVSKLPGGTAEQHLKAIFYPPTFSYQMVEYCEDPFWKERVVEIPEGCIRPQKRLGFGKGAVPPVDWTKEISDESNVLSGQPAWGPALEKYNLERRLVTENLTEKEKEDINKQIESLF